jgi:hypothetical protein
LARAAESGHSLADHAAVDRFRDLLHTVDGLAHEPDPDTLIWRATRIAGGDHLPTPQELRQVHDLYRLVAVQPQPAVRPPRASEIDATGRQPRSEVFPELRKVDEWDELTTGGLDALVAELKDRSGMSVTDKLERIRSGLFAAVGYEPSWVGGNLDLKNLRFYEWQTGELYIHAAAMMIDPDATIEVSYEPYRYFTQFRGGPSDPYLDYQGPVPDGMTRDLMNQALLWRSLRGASTHDIDPATIANELIDMQIRPLRSALTMRRNLIEEYGIDPRRIRLSCDDQPRQVHYANTRFRRAHLVALPPIRDTPVEARLAMVNAMRGAGERGDRREARARAVAERLFGAHEGSSGERRKYALLWMRDTRLQVGAFMDTKPELVRQTIEQLRAADPDRRIVLVGDDLMRGWPALREQFASQGVLEGVDARTLVRYWTADRNGGQALGYGEQALFLHYLNSQRDIVQIGMESGALEIPIMLGVPTIYFQALEHVGDKGVRWQLYWDEWTYGRSQQARDEHGRPLFFDSGRPVKTFEPVGNPRPAPLRTIHRVEFGPALPNPADREAPPVAVHQPATVVLAADRIMRLVDSDELDHWPQRLGRWWSEEDAGWRPWDGGDWDNSRYFADQVGRWLHTDAATIEAAAHKWDAIRESLAGVAHPRADRLERYRGSGYSCDDALPLGESARLEQAYAQATEERGRRVTAAVRDVLDTSDFRRQAIDDLRTLRLTPDETNKLRQTIERVAEDRGPKLTPFGRSVGESAEIPADGQKTAEPGSGPDERAGPQQPTAGPVPGQAARPAGPLDRPGADGSASPPARRTWRHRTPPGSQRPRPER